MSGWDWDFMMLRYLINGPSRQHEPKYIFTDDLEEFLNRIEQRALCVLKNEEVCDNLRYLEDLDRVKAVRGGADIFEVFPLLREWRDKR
jgi:hypothetical protein